MIRHGSPYMTVAPMAHWPMTRRMPISEMNRAQGTLARKTNAARSQAPHKITLIRPVAALPDRQRFPARTIPKLFYP
jgi:hypothetical protein